MAQHRTVDKTTFTEIGKWTKEKIEAKGTELNATIEDKVDKVSGKSLVDDTLITQITTNKTDITSIQEQLTGVDELLTTITTKLDGAV